MSLRKDGMRAGLTTVGDDKNVSVTVVVMTGMILRFVVRLGQSENLVNHHVDLCVHQSSSTTQRERRLTRSDICCDDSPPGQPSVQISHVALPSFARISCVLSPSSSP